ncbi:mucin-19-like [Branchiostoma floridae]|uniref:Mucin-19-like n=1 Tax=Branchiostoma floridae TaxID=7739 RepID=A0A9J7N4N3_BRAFL|nr:mucin-19-like [Branchiostoma floridae]
MATPCESDGTPLSEPTVAGCRKTLLEFWSSGMTNYGTDEGREKLKMAVQTTGLPELTVKHWIDNEKRKGRGKKRKEKLPDPYGRRKRPCDLFKKEFMKGKAGPSVIAEANAAWASRQPEESQKYEEMAAQSTVPTVDDLSTQAKGMAATKLKKKMAELVSKMQSLGCDVFCLVYDSNTPSVWDDGSPKARAFFQERMPGLDTQFILAVGGPSAPTKIATAKERAEVVGKVTDKLNAIAKATPGLRRKKGFPYGMVRDKKAVVEGLPEGVQIRELSTMGLPDLRKLLAVLEQTDNISLRVVDERQASTDVPGTSALTAAPASTDIPGLSALTAAPASTDIPGLSALTAAPASTDIPGLSALTAAPASTDIPGLSALTAAPASTDIPGLSALTAAPASTDVPGLSALTAAPASTDVPGTSALLAIPAPQAAPQTSYTNQPEDQLPISEKSSNVSAMELLRNIADRFADMASGHNV